jgi:hypothetical protein
MVRSVVDSGTQTATIGTEYTLRDETAAEGEVYDAAVDLTNMQSGDALELRLYVKLLSGGTLHRVYYAKFADAQDDESQLVHPVVYVPAMTVAKEWKLTLKQTAGTGRNYDWTIYK